MLSWGSSAVAGAEKAKTAVRASGRRPKRWRIKTASFRSKASGGLTQDGSVVQKGEGIRSLDAKVVEKLAGHGILRVEIRRPAVEERILDA